MDNYPNLSKMGIDNPDEIISYALINSDRDKDYLRIKYRRPSGSHLAVNRGYEFHRTLKASEPKATVGGQLTDYEISPILSGALDELDRIVRRHQGKSSLIADALEHIEHLEREILSEVRSLREKLKKLQSLG